jgi:hypothetical protein
VAILTDEEKRLILFRAQAMAGTDKEKRWNLQELGAALRIIEKTLGRQWYQKSGKNLTPQIPTSPPSNYNFLLEKQKLPPITALLRGGHPENYAKLIQFATYLKELWNQTNIEQKIKDYERQERRREISFDHFNRFFFELKVATDCKRKGLDVHFIPKQAKKTPDLRISSSQGTAYIECKKKDPQTELEKEISDVCQEIETKILNKMLELRLNYAINVTFRKKIERSDINPVLLKTNQILSKQSNNMNEHFGNISIDGNKLANIDATQPSNSLPALPDFSTVQDFIWAGEVQKPNVEPIDIIKLREIDVPVRNYRQVTIYSSFVPSKVQTILNSVKDASQQLLDSNVNGIVAIEISLSNRNANMDLQQLFANLPKALEEMPHVNAAIFFIEQTLKEGEYISKKTIFHLFINPVASTKLPKEIEEALKTSIHGYPKSLLDD